MLNIPQFILKKSFISNWSNGLNTTLNLFIFSKYLFLIIKFYKIYIGISEETFLVINYNLFIYKRAINKRTNQGKINLLKVINKTLNKIRVKTTWLKKKKGTNCGIFYIYSYYIFFYIFRLLLIIIK